MNAMPTDVQTWEEHIRVPIRIVNITNEKVHVDGLIDEDREVFEEIVFRRILFDDPSLGDYMIMDVKRRTGELVVTLEQDDGSVPRDLFEADIEGLDELDDELFEEPITPDDA